MAFVLRDYQRNALNKLYLYWAEGGGNGLIVLPTGGGKSLVIAALCQELLADYPGMRIAMVTHVRELIAQNFKELKSLWPEAPAGVYSAGMNKRETDAKILFCGVQSVWNKVPEIGAIDLLLIDEAHLCSHNVDTIYRKFIEALKLVTPDMRIVGLTATAFRLDTGWLHKGKGRIFDDIVYEANVRNLIERGYLCKLISKKTVTQMDVSKVGKRAGEFITSELEIAVDRDWITKAACREITELAEWEDKKAWLVFCVTVNHAVHVTEELQALGVAAGVVFGHTPKKDRDRIIQSFRDGEFTALVSVMVLGVGFNVPHVDLIALLRPTASGGLFVQQVGRGLRNAEGKQDCLVLDFAGNTLRHGPIDLVRGHEKGAKSEADKTAAKDCPQCHSLVPHGVTVCPDCGFEFPIPERKLNLPTADAGRDIVSNNKPEWIEVNSVTYREHEKYGQPDAPHTLRVNYYSRFASYSEWVCFDHEGFPYEKAVRWWQERSRNPHLPAPTSVAEALERKRELIRPERIMVRPDGKFHRIVAVRLTPALAIFSGDDIDLGALDEEDL